MKKIPTIFVRDMAARPVRLRPEWKPGCEWVRDGDGLATVKIDGSCCLVRAGVLYKRRELKPGQEAPEGFEVADVDDDTGKTVGWVMVGNGPDDIYHREALLPMVATIADGTYELVGPKVQGNTLGLKAHRLVRHGFAEIIEEVPRTFDGLQEYLQTFYGEGVVWHHPDGRMAKIKRRDFGLPWPRN